MKQALSMLVSAALVLPSGLSAVAADPIEQRLTQVAQTVKQILQIDNTYTSFSGDLEESTFRALWSLNWENTEVSLHVTASENGTIYRYSYQINDRTVSNSSTAIPSFPKLTQAQAQQKAQQFLNQILAAPESAVLSSTDNRSTVNGSDYHFNAFLSLYGLSSPIRISITVDAETGEILRFNRDDQYTIYTGEIVDPTVYDFSSHPEIEEYARTQLKNTFHLRLQYVLDDSGKRAVLRYVPEPRDEFYVNAETGELVNLTELTKQLIGDDNYYAAASGADMESMDNGLSPAEQSGIAQMANVLSQETLDKKARVWPELGLQNCVLSSSSYRLDSETGDVTAYLYYIGDTALGTFRRTIILDGKTGALRSVSGSTWVERDGPAQINLEQAQQIAQTFLKKLWPEQASTCMLYQATDAENDYNASAHRFRFAQQVNGHPFPTNSISIAVDVTDGTICSLSKDYEATPTFDSADNLISPQEALDAWFSTYETQLGYTPVPDVLYAQSSDLTIYPGEAYPYLLELGFTAEQTIDTRGIDAKTAQPITWENTTAALVYPDLEQSWAKEQAQALASYGIGWLGQSLQPQKQLTQLDFLALLASTNGILVDLSEDGAEEQVYEHAYMLGLLQRTEREDTRLVTRAELVKMLLDNGGYGKAAQIPDIFRCTFADADRIPQAYYGYAAIAQGLGIVSGDEHGNFAAGQVATREEAIAILYQFMAR